MNLAVWRSVRGLPDYEVSFYGAVQSHKSGRWVRLKPTVAKNGYYVVNLSHGGRSRQYYVHRLVAAAFCARSTKGGREVNHLDGDKLNNVATNLEWVTAGENVRHALKSGLMCSKDQPVIRVDTGARFPTITAAAESIGSRQASLSHAFNTRGGVLRGVQFKKVG